MNTSDSEVQTIVAPGDSYFAVVPLLNHLMSPYACIHVQVLMIPNTYTYKTIEGFKRHSLRIAPVEALSAPSNCHYYYYWATLMLRYVQNNFGRSIGDQGDSDKSRSRIIGQGRSTMSYTSLPCYFRH